MTKASGEYYIKIDKYLDIKIAFEIFKYMNGYYGETF